MELREAIDPDFGDPAATGPDGGLPRLAGAAGRDVGAARPGGGRVPGGLDVQAGGASLRLPDPLDRGGGRQRRGGRDGDGVAVADRDLAVGAGEDLAGRRAVPPVPGGRRVADVRRGPLLARKGRGCCRGSGRSSSASASSRRAASCRAPSSGSPSSTSPRGSRAWPWRVESSPSRPGRWGSPSGRANCSRRPCSIARWSAPMSYNKTKADESLGRFAYDGLERVFHEKARLGIMTSLVTNPKGLLFSDLKELCAPHRRQPQPPPPGPPRSGLRRGLQGVRAEPAPDDLPAHRRRPRSVPGIHHGPRERRRRRPDRHEGRPLDRQGPRRRGLPGLTTRRIDVPSTRPHHGFYLFNTKFLIS